MEEQPVDHNEVFRESSGSRARDGSGLPLTDEMIAAAEAVLGYRLPRAYIRLLRARNGGFLAKCCHPSPEPTSWAEDHVCIPYLKSIGDEDGIDGVLGSRYLIKEWGYPSTGVVIGEGENNGHTALMLDYGEVGPEGEPRVVRLDEEYVERDGVHEASFRKVALAPDFETFLAGLTEKPPNQEDASQDEELRRLAQEAADKEQRRKNGPRKPRR